MAADCAVDPAGEPARLNERFAALIEGGRAEIIGTFTRGCTEQYPFITESGAFREHASVTASDVISDVVHSVRAGQVRIGPARRADARAITRAGRDECMSLADGLGVAVLLLNTMLGRLAGFIAGDQELMPCFSVAVAALNESITRHMHAVAGASAANALDRVHRAQVEERRRLARDLHDRVGEALAVGIRRLDLQEIPCPGDPLPQALPAPAGTPAGTTPATPNVSREALVEAMRRLRVVTCDLREPPVASLEKALMRHLDSVRADADVRLHISGDEAWAPPAVLDEVFLILREALRNALTHAAPQLVLIGVEIAARELTAWVMDDGCGFSPPAATATASGTGLASMRERAALVGGRLVVSSLPGHGTRVELHLPLPDSDGGADDLTGH